MKFLDTVTDQIFRIYRILGREIIARSSNKRPSSTPYITGDGFRLAADHVYDNFNKELNPKTVTEGGVIFVGDSLIEEFVSEIHPNIKNNYKLITHNGDAKITKELFERISNKLIHWYGINIEHIDPRITPLPLGIENKHYYVCGIPTVFNFVKNHKTPKRNKIFYGFSVSTNPKERGPALEIAKSHQDCETLNSWRGFFSYLLTLNQYKLVLSPPGSCEEGHRTWDTMYIGGIPIVKSSPTTEYFKNIGVPLLTVNNWVELTDLNNKTIPVVYESILAKSNSETLNLTYWIKKIKGSDS